MRRVAIFGSGSPLSCIATERLAQSARVTAVIYPDLPWRSRLRSFLRRSSPQQALERTAKRLGAAFVPFTSAANALSDADIIVIASFPRRIPAELLARAPAVNVHMSLLPRHRGPDPLFAVYWHDDRETGVTIHRATGRIDAGEVLAQQSVTLPRGLASRDLYMDLAGRGADLLVRSLDAVCEGRAGSPQDESMAVAHCARDLLQAVVPLQSWPAERVWHVLSGLGDQRSGLVVDASGRRLSHGRAQGFRIGASDPGRIEPASDGWLLHAADGVVSLLRR